jgi:NAD(P)H-nitrite reductase large subunit
MDPKPIKRCVCHETTFQELKDSGLKTVEALATQFSCTTGCGLCKPYIELMLKTGETEFAIFADL